MGPKALLVIEPPRLHVPPTGTGPGRSTRFVSLAFFRLGKDGTSHPPLRNSLAPASALEASTHVPATSWICLCWDLFPMARLARHVICPRAMRIVRSYPSCTYSSASTMIQSHFPSRYRLHLPPLDLASLLTSSATKLSCYGIAPAATSPNGCEQDMKELNRRRDGLIDN